MVVLSVQSFSRERCHSKQTFGSISLKTSQLPNDFLQNGFSSPPENAPQLLASGVFVAETHSNISSKGNTLQRLQRMASVSASSREGYYHTILCIISYNDKLHSMLQVGVVVVITLAPWVLRTIPLTVQKHY